MVFLDVVVHISNFLAPALGVGLIAAFITKLLWRRELASVAVLRLAVWSCLSCAAVLVAGLLIVGRDGSMGTYAAMLVANAVALWWAAWGRSRNKA